MVRHLLIGATGVAVSVAISGCVNLRETQPAHTATEELLEAHAAEIAARHLATGLGLPAGTTVFVDASHFKGDNADYGQSAIDAALLQDGVILAADRKSAKLVVELRMGALSIDQQDTVVGLPAGYLPIPGTLSAFPIPELSVYSSNRRIGTAEFSAFAYDAATGRPVAFAGPAPGQRKLVYKKYLTVFGTGSRIEQPGPPKPKKP